MQCTARAAVTGAFLPATKACKQPRTLSCAPQRQLRARRKVVAQAAAVDAEKLARFPRWDLIYDELNKSQLESILPSDAAALIEEGRAVLVDVRPKEFYEKGHPEGAVSAPVFQNMGLSQISMGKLLKMGAMALNGVTPTEYNPEFVALIKEAAAEGKAVILACEAGGTMAATTNFPTGKTSRSLKGCWQVIRSGAASKCYHLEGGVYRWFASGLPMTGEYDGKQVGRTPAAVDVQQQ